MSASSTFVWFVFASLLTLEDYVPRAVLSTVCCVSISVLSEEATFFYKCDNFYNKESEGGIIYNDPTLSIDWQLAESSLIVSEKDLVLPTLEAAKL